jgi:HSP20 family protein
MAEKEEPRGGITQFRPRSLQELRQEMSRLWDAMGGPGFSLRRFRPFLEEPAWPAVDIFERNGALVVKADVPGLTAKDIEVTVNEGSVTISGERTEEKEVKEKDFYRSERSYGRFVRQLALPAGADISRAQATFKEGILEISIPMKEESKQKKIEVKGA